MNGLLEILEILELLEILEILEISIKLISQLFFFLTHNN